jgi:hypothetical protein
LSDEFTVVVTIDRLVHYSIIFKMNVESYRRKVAWARNQKQRGRPATIANDPLNQKILEPLPFLCSVLVPSLSKPLSNQRISIGYALNSK